MRQPFSLKLYVMRQHRRSHREHTGLHLRRLFVPRVPVAPRLRLRAHRQRQRAVGLLRQPVLPRLHLRDPPRLRGGLCGRRPLHQRRRRRLPRRGLHRGEFLPGPVQPRIHFKSSDQRLRLRGRRLRRGPIPVPPVPHRIVPDRQRRDDLRGLRRGHVFGIHRRLQRDRVRAVPGRLLLCFRDAPALPCVHVEPEWRRRRHAVPVRGRLRLRRRRQRVARSVLRRQLY